MHCLRRACTVAGFLAGLLAPLPAFGAASPWVVNGPSQLRLLTPTLGGLPAGALRLGLHFRLQPGWHVYWKNSGDAGYPPAVTVSGAPAGITAELLYPAPRRFELPGDLVAFGYEKDVVYPLAAHRDAQPTTGSEHLAADVDYLVCQVDCIPFRSRLEVTQPLGAPATADPETAGLLAAAWASLPTPVGAVPGLQATARYDPAGLRLVLDLRPARLGVAAAAGERLPTDLFIEPQDLFETGRPLASENAGGVRFVVPLRPKTRDALPAALDLAWTATGVVTGVVAGQPSALSGRQRLDLHMAADPADPAATPSATGPALRGRAVALALAAVVSTLLALTFWGLLAGPFRPQAAGFAAAAFTLLALYALARTVRPEGLALVELCLLAIGLAAWLRRRATSGSKLALLLSIALGLAAATAVWLAARFAFGVT